jgi:hypothetical protein
MTVGNGFLKLLLMTDDRRLMTACFLKLLLMTDDRRLMTYYRLFAF